MNESKCKACDADLVYVGSITRGGALKCLACENKETIPPAKKGLGGSYLYANTQDPEDQFPCEYCGTFHKVWEACPDDLE